MEVLPPNPLDVKILALADSHSPEEISERLGGIVRPKTVASRVAHLLKTKNWLTAAQQDQLYTLRMSAILEELEQRYMDKDMAKLRLNVLKELSARLDKRAAATQVDLNALYGNQGRIMLQAFDVALSYMKGALRDEVDADRWDELRVEAIAHAKSELDKYEAIEA